jgi:creatinine amidohydrolase
MSIVEESAAMRELSCVEASGLEPSEWLVIWPIASLEQHGPLLPLGTDAIVLGAVVDRARKRLEESVQALYLPLMPVGKSPEHLAFPGSVSMSAVTLLGLADGVVSSLAPHGFCSYVFLNGHGGNTALLRAAAPDLRARYGVRVYNIDLWASSFFYDIIEELFPGMAGIDRHGGAAETSMVLHLCPHLVQGTPDYATLRAGGGRYTEQALGPIEFDQLTWGIPFGWQSQDFGYSGVVGDPSIASADAGRQILEYAVDRVCASVTKIYDAV